jgi:type IV pilus assembly protein PilV
MATLQMGVINMKRNINKTGGFSMMEVLITMLIILLGLLGIVALQTKAQIAELESYQRTQALMIMDDIVDKINANKQAINCFVVTTNAAAGTPYLGEGIDPPTGCTASTTNYNAQADAALAAIDGFLDGSAEALAGLSAGAMTGGRACITYDATTEIGGVPGTGYYKIMVSWQGMEDLPANTADICAAGLYGTAAASDTRRRTVATFLRLADTA